MKWQTFGLLALVTLLTWRTDQAFAADRPNVVMIISDDHAWTDYSFMGHPTIKTPNIDKLANESVVFRRGYVTASLCCPSLASILTGKYPHQTKVTGNEPQHPPGIATRPAGQLYKNPRFQELLTQFNGLIGKHPRLPSELAKVGYVSLQTGKWWGGNFSTGGFTHGMSHGDPGKGGRHGDDGLKIGRQTMQPIFDFIEQNQGKPFFVWYAPMLPHDPHTPPDRILAKYKDKTPSLHVAKYWANVEFFDETCGQLLDYLEQKKLKDNTIIVYVADNGWIQDPQTPRFRADSKQSQYDGGLRTPIMIRWPGKTMPRFDNTPVSAIDIAPTLYKACGVDVPPGLTGINLLDPQAVSKRGPVFGSCAVHTAIDFLAPEKNWTYRWVVAGDWKLVVPNEATVKKVNRPGREVEVELYQIAADPHEEKNLSAEKPEKVAELRKLLDAWWDGQAVKEQARDTAVDPDATAFALLEDSRIVRSGMIFDPPPTPGCHASTIVETPDGIAAAWFAGKGEGASDVGIWFSRLVDEKWTVPVEIANGIESESKRYPTWNPVLFQPKVGPLVLFYKVGPSPSKWWGMSKTSADGGKTWSAPTRLPDGILGPVKNKGIVLADGTLLAGSSSEEDGWRVHFERSNDNGKTWTRTDAINDGKEFGIIQPAFLMHPEGKIQALCRSRQKRVVETWSTDGGKTWSKPAALEVPNPNSGIDAVTLRDGRHLLVYNPVERGRSPLSVAISRDPKQWTKVIDLETESGEYSYPAVIQSKDGLVHITYTHKRKHIKHVVLDPAKLAAEVK